MTLQQYIDKVNSRFKTGITTEHSFRGDLQTLIENIVPGIMATNEPTHIDCGAPDYIITKRNIPLGYIEAKDINADLDNKNYKEQFDRYKNSLDNLIITDYLTFNFYKESKLVTSISIGSVEGKKIIPLAENFEHFTSLIKDFCSYTGQTIRSAQKLSKMMAGKARMLANIIENALNSDEEKTIDSTLHAQMKAFKDILIHDITIKEFADIYAQTIAYGMFAARLHDPTLENFARQEAAELIPKSNPFLRKLFGYIAGPDIDERIIWVVDALADIFRATDVADLLKNFGSSTQQTDPIIHFYETFLAEYDPKLRKARGVWYTPEPVVNFIVRAVDDILKTEFNLPDGLADRSKTKVKVNVQGQIVEQEVHKVQILDPAAGTGTFLAEIIKQVYKKFTAQQGSWSSYVEEHLIPRLNGFELLMASYAMAHLKLDLLLRETGYTPSPLERAGVRPQRLKVYLTNSLEEHHPDTGTLFANWLSTEANEANHIKRDSPVMVVLGNPPYSGESANGGEWIENLIEIYKLDNNRQKIPDTKWLNNDYVKFLRYGQHFIEKNGSGVLAFITDNSFLDSISFRGMRWNLLKTYDTILTLNLHGNSKKKETTPDGSIDQNVFDIMQGVSINLFIKTGKKKADDLGKLLHYDLYGKREFKYDYLFSNSIKLVNWNKLNPNTPNFFLVPKDFSSKKEYDTFIKFDELLNLNGVGICSKRDETAIKFSKNELIEVLNDFKSLSESELKFKYRTEITESRDKKLNYAKENIAKFGTDDKYLQQITYRPFDTKWTYFTNQSRGFLAYPVYAIMRHFTQNNLGLVVSKKSRQLSLGYMFITKLITDLHILDSAADSTYVFALYLYPDNDAQQTLDGKQQSTPNLNKEIVNKIAQAIGLTFVNEKSSFDYAQDDKTFAPIDLLDYIYAVLHSPTYREKYKEFLKIDFPRVPYPKDKKTFWQLVKLGSELRQIHLLENDVVNNFITTFPIDGNNTVEKIKYENDKVWMNSTQYFDKVPQVAWEFYIGGYKPAQKWLKDRKSRTLNFDDIQHYQKIIVALSETDRIMKEIDKIKF